MSKPQRTSGEAAADSEEAPSSAAAALAIIEAQQASVTAELMPNLVLLHGIWGVAWTAAFGAFYVTGAGILDVPVGVAGSVMAVAFVLAAAVSIAHSLRANRGVRGPSDAVGAMYGISWPLSMIGLGLLLGGIRMPNDVEPLLYPAAFVLMVGVMYLSGGTLWNDRLQYGLGVWLIAIAAGSAFLGTPDNYLLLAIGGGGGLLAIAGYHAAGSHAR